MSTDLERIDQPLSPTNLFGVDEPQAVIRRASEHADALADVIRAKHLYKTIGGKNHVLVEAWTMLGSMLGVFPVVVWTRQLENGWEARVEARTLSGAIVGAAEAECLVTERNWKGRDDYAIRSMAQTRATSKALRGPLGFIVTLAGYSATPAEEMPTVDGKATRSSEGKKATKEQHARLGVIVAKLEKDQPREDGITWEDRSRDIANELFGVSSRADLTTVQMSEVMDRLEAEGVPFG